MSITSFYNHSLALDERQYCIRPHEHNKTATLLSLSSRTTEKNVKANPALRHYLLIQRLNRQ
jgi:hypothetical protein